MVYQTISPKNAVPPADDSFHILRDCRAQYLKQLGQLLQEAEHASAVAVQAFQQTVGGYFDEMTSPSRRSGFDSASGLTASRISLVGENDLELEIRLGEFANHLQEATGGDLWRVYLRFITLLRRPDLSPADNPVGPKGITLGLQDFCRKLEENHERTLARLDRLETYFSRHLTVLYDALNTFLIEHRVEAAQPAIITTPDSPGSQTPGTAAPNPLAALQKSLLAPGREPDAESMAGTLPQAQQASVFARFEELEKAGKMTPKSPGAFSIMATHPSLEALIPGLFTTEDDAGLSPPQTLNSSELGIPTGAPEAASIDALALVFENIFTSTQLPEAIKSALSRLQIPLLKTAMLDPGFFSNPNHVARQLFDKIGRAALGLPLDVPAAHPLCSRIQAITARIHADFADDSRIFEQAVSELNALIKERDEAAARSAAAYIPLLHQVERRKQATRRCRQTIEQHLAHGAPASIAAFLRNHWQKVLLVVWMENGEQSPAWKEQNSLISDLLWSIQPKTEIEDRKSLAKMLQPMLQRLNAGMARINMPEDAQAAFLDTCFALQTAAMRGAAESTPELAPPAATEPAQNFSELSSGNLLLKIFDQPAGHPGATRLRTPAARPGSWLLLSLNGADGPICGELCPDSPESSLHLIANPDWGFAVAIHPAILENMFAAGSARVCSTDSLFDSAAEKALSRTSGP